MNPLDTFTQNSSASYQILLSRRKKRPVLKVSLAIIFLFIVILFLPWTQNIRSTGVVTALKPQQRPQAIQNIIPGRIEKWYVQEGQLVMKGDTILQISEVKSEYLNPDLVKNTEQQLQSKNSSVKSYMQKIEAIDVQINALIQSRAFKYEQAQNKLQQSNLKYRNDSIELSALVLNEKIADEQMKRMDQMYKEGLKSLTEQEARKLKLQEAQVKTNAQRNKIIASKNDVINARIELQNINADYREKISKLESDKNSALSAMYDAEATVTKLQNDVVNYTVRSGMYFITAPQDGYVSKAIQSGIGENIKEGTDIVTIVPLDHDLAVEMFVKPMDIPLLQPGQHVQIQFDGWPSMVFSGWPGISFGTFGGKIMAIDNYISNNGKYRVLVARDEKYQPWPKEIRQGAGAGTFTMLKDVPVWYELWRQINGFPPDYYKGSAEKKEKNKK